MKNLKLYLFSLLSLSFIMSSCSDDDDTPAVVDLEAPSFAEVTSPAPAGSPNVIEIRGSYYEVRSETSDHIDVRGTVTDNMGLSQMRLEIHGAFDGHTHGRITALNSLDVDMVMDLNGQTSYNFDITIDYDEEDFRAAPYHVGLEAVDMSGNATSPSDGSTVSRGIYLMRPYMPGIILEDDPNGEMNEIELHPNEEMHIHGFIEQHRGGKDFDVTFIRISISEDDDHDHDHGRITEESYEAIWGQSIYLATSGGMALSGDPIPAFTNDQISLDDLLEAKPYIIQESDNHKILRIEVEDEGGNLSIKEYEIEAHDHD